MAVPGRISAGRAGPVESAIVVATPASAQDSSLVTTMAGADGLIVRPPRAERAKAGETCRVIPFHGLGV
jgi:molybdopterin biosynthesis enzyme